MSERLTIKIEPSAGHGGQLSVEDAMRQVLDFIEVVAAAANDDARQKFEWMLVSASTNSPFTAEAEAVSINPDWPVVDDYARLAKSRFNGAVRSAQETGEVPDWMPSSVYTKFQRLFERNLNGIGKTTYSLFADVPPIVIVERHARSALENMHSVANSLRSDPKDLSGEELGSIDCVVLEAMTHYGKPALRVRDRLTDEKVICVFDETAADEVGGSHSWDAIWSGQRVIVSGLVKRNKFGIVTHVEAEDLRDVPTSSVRLSELADASFTGGKSPQSYLDEVWNGQLGED